MMRKRVWKCAWMLGLLSAMMGAATAQTASSGAKKFHNPLLASGPDPWVLQWQGTYYYTATTGRNLTLWKTREIADLEHAEKKVVWTPEPGQAWSKDVWAPEIHRWGNKWYIYFAADGGRNEDHRIYVIENSSADPMSGEWVLKGKVADATDSWAIDASIFEVAGTHYMIWSGWKGAENGEQDIYIARMSNPWTISSERVLISAPAHTWEKKGDLGKLHIDVNEGPEALVHGGKVFVVFSASACWTDDYALGMLEADAQANLLDAKSWTKIDHPVFQKDAKAGVFAPGHNGFFQSADGREDWIIYHANSASGDGCSNKRSPRMQRFTWGADGRPVFGKPLATTTELDAPGAK